MDWHPLGAAKTNRRGVHNLQITLYDVQIRERFKHGSRFVFSGIRGVDPVDFGGLQYRIGLDLERSQSGGRVSREERVAGARSEDNDPALFAMANRAPAYERLGYLIHFNRAHDSSEGALIFKSVLQRDGVDYRRQHAHVIG